MKKALLRLGICMVFLFTGLMSHAQLNNVVVPDFTITDLDGETHNLYDYLDEGKTVIIDVYATWCGPCWNYHQTHTLEDMHKSYGPDGSDDVIVMGIEGDAATSVAAITGGAGGNTLGNWRDGVSYIMADDASVGNLLQVNAYPTVFRICPVDKKIYELPLQPTRQVIKSAVFNGNCTVPLHASDPAIVDLEVLENVCPGGETEMSAVVFNSGTSPIAFAIVEVLVDGEVQSQTQMTPGTTLSSFQEAVVELPSLVIEAETEVTVRVVTGAVDDYPSNNMASKTIKLYEIEEVKTLTLDLTTDGFGCETYWKFENDNGEILAEGGNPAAMVGGQQWGNGCAGVAGYGANENVVETIVIPADGCYQFTMIDDWGDGLTTGGFTLTDNQGNVVLNGASAFGSEVYAVQSEVLIYAEADANQVACQGGEIPAMEFAIGNGFEGEVTVSVEGAPGTISFDNMTSTPGGMVTATISDLSTPGEYDMVVTATDGTKTGTQTFTITILGTPNAATLTTPADMAVNVAPTPFLLWSPVNGVDGYVVEISDDMNFMNIVYTANRPPNQANLIIPGTAGLVNGLTYHWRVVTENACEAASSMVRTFTVENTTSVGELNGVAVDVMPNPTRGMVNVAFSQPMTDVALQVFTIDGKLLQSQMVSNATSNVEVNLADYQNGIYILKLVNENVSLTNRVMLNK